MATLTALCFGVLLSDLVFSHTINDCPASVPRDTYLQVYQDSCFQFVINRERRHSVAKADCEHHGGTLAIVNKPEIQGFIYHQLVSTYKDFRDKLWIGLNDIDNENIYKWEDGSALIFTNWDSGDGPHADSYYHAQNHNENDCTVIDMESGGRWAEFPCEETSFLIFFHQDEEHSYICQYKLSPTATAIPTTLPPPTSASTEVQTDSTTRPVTEMGEPETATTALSVETDTTVSSITNPCPPFTCDLDCGMDGFKKNATSGCSLCECDL
ncbi:unnamed protein product [Lymnaea stagnalis]|uniref:C-type lectin domain-containing protein n=1 Tax=Lymnaea stagnalis TaxID=6523 RepID=A0AAV2H0H3_LYMST